MSHRPQLLGSLRVSTQALLQRVLLLPHTQALLWHVAWSGHALSHPPQWLELLVVLTQVSPQSVVKPVVGQRQVPLWQVRPPVQAWPQPPQLAASVFVLTQAAPQKTWGLGQSQLPWTQADLGAEQRTPQPPQLAVSVFVS